MFDMTSIILTALVPTVVIGVVVIAITVVILRKVAGMSNPNKDLLTTGVGGMATIVNLWDTGTTVNDNPMIGMLLEIQPASGTPYQAKTSLLISRLQIPQYQPGRKLAVRIDPRNPQRVAIAGAVA